MGKYCYEASVWPKKGKPGDRCYPVQCPDCHTRMRAISAWWYEAAWILRRYKCPECEVKWIVYTGQDGNRPLRCYADEGEVCHKELMELAGFKSRYDKEAGECVWVDAHA